MKTLKPKFNNIIPVKQITRDVAVFFINIAIIIGIYILSIYLNSMDASTEGFWEYFNKNFSNFLYLTLSLVLFMAVLMFCMYFDDKTFFK